MVSYHSGQFGPPYTDSSPRKNLSRHTETNKRTKNSSVGGTIHSCHSGYGATQYDSIHRANAFLKAALEEP